MREWTVIFSLKQWNPAEFFTIRIAPYRVDPNTFVTTYKFELELLITTELVMLELKPTA